MPVPPMTPAQETVADALATRWGRVAILRPRRDGARIMIGLADETEVEALLVRLEGDCTELTCDPPLIREAHRPEPGATRCAAIHVGGWGLPFQCELPAAHPDEHQAGIVSW